MPSQMWQWLEAHARRRHRRCSYLLHREGFNGSERERAEAEIRFRRAQARTCRRMLGRGAIPPRRAMDLFAAAIGAESVPNGRAWRERRQLEQLLFARHMREAGFSHQVEVRRPENEEPRGVVPAGSALRVLKVNPV